MGLVGSGIPLNKEREYITGLPGKSGGLLSHIVLCHLGDYLQPISRALPINRPIWLEGRFVF